MSTGTPRDPMELNVEDRQKPVIHSCATCWFWEPDPVKGPGPPQGGDCRRYPPMLVGDWHKYLGWPATKATDWCGEWSRAVDA